MKPPEKIELVNCDPEDIQDAIGVVQQSFGIELDAEAFINAKTFGDLCDVVEAAALQREHRDGCTGQQGFYRVRAAMVSVLRRGNSAKAAGVGPEAIAPVTRMRDLFPRRGRQRMMRELQRELGIGMGLLNLKRGVGWWIFGCFLISFLWLFINWRYGLAGIAVCMLLNQVAWRLGNEFMYVTVGDVAHSFSLCYYRLARRDPQTVNREEIVPVIKGIFMRVLGVGPEALTREAAIG